jgi:hypothetical protein
MRDHVFPAEPVYVQSGAWQLMASGAMTGDQSEIPRRPLLPRKARPNTTGH